MHGLKPTDDLARELHERYDLERPELLDLNPDKDLIRLRLGLVREEAKEVFEELEALIAARRTAMRYMILVRLAKELADLRMALEGTAVSFGIDLEAVYREVHRSNMTKDAHPDGGKLVKGRSYVPADVERALGHPVVDGTTA